jgi:hypothetical protein
MTDKKRNVIGFHKDKIIDAQGLEGFFQMRMKLKKSANLTFNQQVMPQAFSPVGSMAHCRPDGQQCC